MKNTQNLIIKQKIARFCVILIICTTVFGTFLAFSGENNSAKKKLTKSFLKENKTSAGNTLTTSYKDN